MEAGRPRHDIDVRAFALDVAKDGGALSSTQVRHIRRLAEVFKCFLRLRWQQTLKT